MFIRAKLRFDGASCTRPRGRLPVRSLLLAAFSFVCLSSAGATTALAQAQPPDRFYGTVKINGKDQPVGTVVDAYIGDTLCGSGSVQDRSGAVIYVVDVLGGGQKPGCATDGDTVTFKVAGLSAPEKGTYQTGTATRLDLTASGSPEQAATQTVLPAGGGGTPAPSPTPPPTVAVTSTPLPPPSQPPATSPTPAAASPTATSTATLSATPTAIAASSSASTVSPSVAALAAATGTPQPEVAAAPLITRSKSSGPPIIAWVLIGVAALAAIGSIGAWFFRQRAGV